jgi:Fe-S cluster assembly protein SufB
MVLKRSLKLMKNDTQEILDSVLNQDYKYGFTTKIQQNILEKGLNIETIKAISKQKNEPSWLLDFRLKAFSNWQKMTPPNWAELKIEPINYQQISYLATPKNELKTKDNWKDDLDPEILKTYQKLGLPEIEQQRLNGVAVDFILDSSSVHTSFSQKLEDLGIIFCSFTKAVATHPDLVQKYLGSVVPATDNFFSCLNSAVFSDGSFIYIPKGVKCPMDLSTYFRINAENIGQFERTLIIAEQDSFVSYLEGCSAPERKQNQLHAAVVELIAHQKAIINYSTVQNWYPGDKNGLGGVYNFVTKRGLAKGNDSKISWTQLETGSSITWKYPSVILKGDNSVGEFYSVTVTNNYQQADTGTKMTHIGKNSRSFILSKSISARNSSNTYRGLVQIARNADFSKNYSQCDSLLIDDNSKAFTYPKIDSKNPTANIQHEAYSGKINQDILTYLHSRGLNSETANNLIISGFCKQITDRLPLEFSIEAKKLLEISMENSLG